MAADELEGDTPNRETISKKRRANVLARLAKLFEDNRFSARLPNTRFLERITEGPATTALGGDSFLFAPPGTSISESAKFSSVGKGNTIILGKGVRLENVKVRFPKRNALVVICDDVHLRHCELIMNGHGSLLFIGSGTSWGGGRAIVGEANMSILIAEDCMFSYDVELRTSDSHPIIDLDTGLRINPPGHVVIEPHVWLGLGAVITKGVRVASGGIVGSRAVVTRNTEPNATYVGAPARKHRSNVAWTRRIKDA